MMRLSSQTLTVRIGKVNAIAVVINSVAVFRSAWVDPFVFVIAIAFINGDAIAIGSGGNFALSAARALLTHTTLDAETVARESLGIAAGIDIYTNGNLVVEKLKCE